MRLNAREMRDMAVSDMQNESVPMSSTSKGSNEDVLSSNEVQDPEASKAEEEKIVPLSNEGQAGSYVTFLESQFHGVNGELHNGVETKEVVSQSLQGSNDNKETGENNAVGLYRHDGLVEISQLAEDLECGEAVTKDMEEKSTENGAVNSDKQRKSTVKTREHQSRVVGKADAKSRKLGALMLKKNGQLEVVNPSQKTCLDRVGANGLLNKNRTFGDNMYVENSKNTTPPQCNLFQRSVSIGSSCSNVTVPQPFALATDKRASIGGRIADGEAGYQPQNVHGPTGSFGSSSVKALHVPKSTGIKTQSMKVLNSESMKHIEKSLVIAGKPLEQKHNDEDSQSVISLQSCSTTCKSISANAFFSKCEERAEKRRQFYSKLEEKYKSREEEKNQLQAKTKEKIETEIKRLRKSLTFKATPMPSFYHEGVPPKAELKKIPPTRAKSPKFCRRHSCMGSESQQLTGSSGLQNHSEQEYKSSTEPKLNFNNDEKSFDKRNKKPIRKSMPELFTEKLLKEHDKKVLLDKDTGRSNGFVDSVKERDDSASGSSSQSAILKETVDTYLNISDMMETPSHVEKEGDCPPQVEEPEVGDISESVSPSTGEQNVKEMISVSRISESVCSSSGDLKVKETTSTITETSKFEATRSKLISSDPHTANKAKTRTSQHVSKPGNQDVKDTSKSTKRERLMASVPSFRSLKHESIELGSVKQTINASLPDVVVQ